MELGVVIGTTGRNIAKADALGHVFGYTVINDLSARDLQQQHLQWFKGKSLDGFCPMGPVVVTADEFGDPQAKRLQLPRQRRRPSRTDRRPNMIFPVDVIIEWLSKGLTLEAGDIIATGTPDGVGMGRTPQEFLQDGDVVETEIEGIGTMRNRIVDVIVIVIRCDWRSVIRDRDKLAIREVIENWALWRDAGDWERFATVWHDDGWMTATWFQGPAQQFIEVSREGFERGVSILHFLGGFTCEVAGNRAIAQTKMTINQRADGRRRARWTSCARAASTTSSRSGTSAGRIVRRQPIYEKDRMDPVDPSRRADARCRRVLAKFPEGYRHLGYLQIEERLHGEGQPAGPARPGRRDALRRRRGLARRLADAGTPL